MLRVGRAAAAAAAASTAAVATRAAARRGVANATGVVGVPNIGKSTLFNGLVRSQLAQAANYPFCTVEPNVALVEVPDPRLAALAALSGSARTLGWQIEYHDIAGLIKGASKGEGLGNAFLGNIRAVNCILQVVRCFVDPEVLHVMDAPDPLRDIAVLETELILADLQSIEKRTVAARGGRATKTPEGALAATLLERARVALDDGFFASVAGEGLTPAEAAVWPKLQLLTQKPMMYVCNVGEGDAATGNAMSDAVKAHVASRATAYAARAGVPPPDAPALAAAHAVVCAKLEAEAALLPDADRAEFLAAYGITTSGLDAIMRQSARLLRLHTFYTTGPAESHAWCIPVGASAVDAAATIHSDFGKAFIRADIVAYDDYLACGGEKGAKDAAKVRSEGKDYIMADGDVAVFRIGNTAGAK